MGRARRALSVFVVWWHLITPVLGLGYVAVMERGAVAGVAFAILIVGIIAGMVEAALDNSGEPR